MVRAAVRGRLRMRVGRGGRDAKVGYSGASLGVYQHVVLCDE
jgi:hypothetical protein